jgi:hypothetical protein
MCAAANTLAAGDTRPRHPIRRDLPVRVFLAVAATAAALIVAVPANAATSTTAVINEVYGGGGISGAT